MCLEWMRVDQPVNILLISCKKNAIKYGGMEGIFVKQQAWLDSHVYIQ